VFGTSSSGHKGGSEWGPVNVRVSQAVFDHGGLKDQLRKSRRNEKEEGTSETVRPQAGSAQRRRLEKRTNINRRSPDSVSIRMVFGKLAASTF